MIYDQTTFKWNAYGTTTLYNSLFLCITVLLYSLPLLATSHSKHGLDSLTILIMKNMNIIFSLNRYYTIRQKCISVFLLEANTWNIYLFTLAVWHHRLCSSHSSLCFIWGVCVCECFSEARDQYIETIFTSSYSSSLWDHRD